MQRSERPVFRTASPVYRTTSPVFRTASPVYRTASPVYRTTSPVFRTASPIYRTTSPVFRTESPIYRTPSPVSALSHGPRRPVTESSAHERKYSEPTIGPSGHFISEIEHLVDFLLPDNDGQIWRTVAGDDTRIPDQARIEDEQRAP